MVACAACGRENADDARFCSGCGGARAPAEATHGEVRKTVTVLFSDVVGSTTLGERLDPESLRRVMGRYFDAMSDVLERHGATVEKFIGDAIMAVFGIPVVHEDDALRAVRAAVEMRERLAGLDEELERDYGVRIDVRTGVNTGEVVAGDPTAGQRLVTGDAVNVAARLEQAAAPGEILLGSLTHRLVASAVNAEPAGRLAAKGKAEPLAPFRVVGVDPRAEPIARRFDAPIVGRRGELQQLEQTWDEVKTKRTCRLVSIIGEPGIGKSRLAAELVRSLADEATILSGRCLPYGEGITYWPLVEIVREAAGNDPSSWLEGVFEGEPEAELAASRIAGAVGAGDDPADSDEIAWAVRKLFERLSRERPLVLVLDDVQWAEGTFLDLVEHLVYLSSAAPILVMCLARPEFEERRPGWPGETLRLSPLAAAETRNLIAQLAETTTLAPELHARITATAAGNPLFVEQMLAMVGTDGGADVSVPPTINALLAARLDQLDQEPRKTIERASVVGQEFWSGALAALGPGENRITPPLLELVRRELIRPQVSSLPNEDAYAFVHLLVRDAAYAGVPKELRVKLHERLASWLDELDERRGTHHEEVVGYHLEQAYRYRFELGPPDSETVAVARRAAERLGTAGRRASLRGDTAAARNLLERAVELLGEDEPLRFELLPDAAMTLAESGDLRRARVLLDQAKGAHEPLVAALARVEQLLISLGDFELAEGENEVMRAIELFERHQYDRGLARAWLVRGEIANGRNDRAEMARAAALAAACAGRIGNHRAEAEALRLFGGALVYGPTPTSEGIRLLSERLAEGVANRMVEAALEAPLAALTAMAGDITAAKAHIVGARLVYEELGLAVQRARLAFMAARVEQSAGDLEAASRELRQGIRTLAEMGERARSTTMAIELTNVLCDRGELEEAERWLAYVGTAVPTFEQEDFLIASTRGRLRALRGDPAGEALARAGARDTPKNDLPWVGLTLTNLADALIALARPDEAVPVLEEAHAVFQAKEDVSGMSTVGARLRELSSIVS